MDHPKYDALLSLGLSGYMLSIKAFEMKGSIADAECGANTWSPQNIIQLLHS